MQGAVCTVVCGLRLLAPQRRCSSGAARCLPFRTAAAAVKCWGKVFHPTNSPPTPPSAFREFQEEVMSRARREMLSSAGASDATASGSSAADLGSAAPPDLPALVDDLRAEVAATRAVVQQLRLQQQQQPGGRR